MCQRVVSGECMSITVAGKNVEIGESLKGFIVQEVEKMTQQDLGDVVAAHAVIDKDNSLFVCDLSIHVSRSFSLRSTGQDADPYKAVALAISLLKQRTRKYRARLRKMERQRRTTDNMDLSRFVLADVQEEEELQEAPLVIAEMPDALQTMSVGDAVMQLDLAELPVFVFRNPSTGQMNVVYRRSDRNIGWIAPKQH